MSGCTGPDRPGLAAARRRACIRCTGKKCCRLHWQESLRPRLRWQERGRWGPVPLFGRRWRARPGPARWRSPSRAYTGASGGIALAQATCFALCGDRLRCRFAHSEGCTGGRWGTAAGTRSRSFSPSLCCAQKRCCSAIAMRRSISRHLYRLSPCWSFSVHSSGSYRLGHARGDNAGLLLVSPDLPRAFLIANNSHCTLVAGAIPLRWRVANTCTAERGGPSTFVPTASV